MAALDRVRLDIDLVCSPVSCLVFLFEVIGARRSRTNRLGWRRKTDFVNQLRSLVNPPVFSCLSCALINWRGGK